MTNPRVHHVRHDVRVAAPPDIVYGLVADATAWPRVFPPTVHVERFDVADHEDGTSTERLRLWATANGAVKTWTSRRDRDPAARTVAFRQEVSAPPVGSMGGLWRVEAAGDGSSLVSLDHDYSAVDDDPDGIAWIGEAVERNSTAELAALRAAAEAAAGPEELVDVFEDSVEVAGSAEDVYAFIWDADEWPQRLDHVARVALTEDAGHVQTLEMDTRAVDGSVHTTSSYRLGFPPDRIVYKQTVLPALLTAHVGAWLIEPVDGGVRVTSRHTVAIKPSAVEPVLGVGAIVADAHRFVRRALGTNSLLTLHHARDHAESRARQGVDPATATR